MSERARNAVFALGAALTISLTAALVALSPSETDRVAAIGAQIKCPVCEGESIADSPADMARDMMGLVEERVAAGLSDQEIIDELLASYSGALHLDPPARGAALVLRLIPILAFVAGAGVIAWWRRHPGPVAATAATEEANAGRGRRRTLIGGLILAAGAVIAASAFAAGDDPPAAAPQDVSEVSNQTLEAVIAENLDDPRVNGMRLALAERYVEAGDHRSAFPHYLAVAKSPGAAPDEAVAALTRLGQMAWESDETSTALGLADEALRIQPGSIAALLLKAKAFWCGEGDGEAAAALLEQALGDGGLDPEARAVAEADLDAVRSGEGCE